LSSLYIDISKDWLYCDAPDSQRRRATQATMHTIFDTLSRLLAPILVFTAEEAWRHFRTSGSVHLQEFFEGGDLDYKAESLFNQALYVRKMIGPHIEQERTRGTIGTSQQASVLVEYPNEDELLDDWWLSQTELLAQILIVSEVNLVKQKGLKIAVTKTPYKKCARCWRHRPTVGTSKAHPDLCDRCESVVVAMTNSE
jgi:isoleucyl-tRNA synthetase